MHFRVLPTNPVPFATLPADLRNEAVALFNLLRSLGSSIGISTRTGPVRAECTDRACLAGARRHILIAHAA
jgi:hypothetical protein